MTDKQVDHILTGYDGPYKPETCAGVMLNNLFSKYGFSDGDDPRADPIHKAFSAHLLQHGYENKIIGGVHNRRVFSIRVNDKWYSTDNLQWGNDWSLGRDVEGSVGGDENDQIPIPDNLKQVILSFLPIGWKMMQMTPNSTQSTQSKKHPA